MHEEKEIYGVSFPTPETMRDITIANKAAAQREEILKVRSKMKEATDYSVTVRELSCPVQEALTVLGYDVTVYTDQNNTILYYEISWGPKSQE